MEHADRENLASNHYCDRNFGSCVAACIRDGESGIGGMSHSMLPDDGGRNVVSSSARHHSYVIEVLVNHLLKPGARRNRREAKVFGGGAVLESLSASNVGVRNAQFVLNFFLSRGGCW